MHIICTYTCTYTYIYCAHDKVWIQYLLSLYWLIAMTYRVLFLTWANPCSADHTALRHSSARSKSAYPLTTNNLAQEHRKRHVTSAMGWAHHRYRYILITYVRTYLHTYMHASHIHTYIRTYIHTYLLTYIYTYIHAYQYTSEHIELPAQLLDYFLRSNKSNINQNMCILTHCTRILKRAQMCMNIYCAYMYFSYTTKYGSS